jgi:hypothetical protein
METPDFASDDIIDYDGTISHDSEFTTLPENEEVTFTVTEIEKGRNSDGTKPQVKAKLLCVSINGKGQTTITDYITMTRKSEWKLCELFISLGMRKHGEPLKLNWDIVGKTGRAVVMVDKYTNRTTGEEKTSNKIKKYLEPVSAQVDGVEPSFG